MVAPCPGVVDGLGAIWSGVTDLVPVLVVGLLVPGAVVEIPVVVGDLESAQPVDGDSGVGIGVSGLGVVPGVGVFGAADGSKAIAVLPDFGVAGRGSGLDEGVVVLDVVGLGIPLGGAVEDEAELLTAGHAIGREAPSWM